MTSGSYDKEYVESKTTGFDEWRAYVLGKEDGVPKTPEWQEAETGVPAKDVRSLAPWRASQKTYLAAGGLAPCAGDQWRRRQQRAGHCAWVGRRAKALGQTSAPPR